MPAEVCLSTKKSEKRNETNSIGPMIVLASIDSGAGAAVALDDDFGDIVGGSCLMFLTFCDVPYKLQPHFGLWQ